MNTITFQIFWKNGDEPDYEALGMPSPKLEGSEVRPIKFNPCQIVGINQYRKDGKVWGCIMANGTEYITNLSYDELEHLIDNL
jgi:hypothetical protein